MVQRVDDGGDVLAHIGLQIPLAVQQLSGAVV